MANAATLCFGVVRLLRHCEVSFENVTKAVGVSARIVLVRAYNQIHFLVCLGYFFNITKILALLQMGVLCYIT